MTRTRSWQLLDKDLRTCFAIMPFRIKKDPAREDKLDFDSVVYEKIMKPAIDLVTSSGLRLDITRADKLGRSGPIHEHMIQLIADADVAIVDITTLNPNVFYELGVRHALRDRVTVLIRRKGTGNPFNIAGLATIEYDDKHPRRAHRAIADFIRNGLLSSARDSLVYSILPDLKVTRDEKLITESSVEEYAVPGAPKKRIGIVMGNLRHTNLTATLRREPIDVWVSSENINMAMARPHEGSMSGLIRYLGARKDETGTIIDDVIAKELAKKMGRRQIVNPSEVVATGAGRLRETHQVQQIFHAAAVYGVVGSGFFPIAKVEECVTNALARMDFDPDRKVRRIHGRNAPKASATSILFPVLGTGTARADVIQSARRQVLAAISYLKSRAEFTRVERVYFLARAEVQRAALRLVFAELGVTRRPAASRPRGRARVARVQPRPPRRRRARKQG